MNKLVAIAVPLYKPVPTSSELISLNQLIKILGKHPIVFYCSETFDITLYQNRIPNAQVIRFNNSYFESINGYSKLMLSSKFYKSFLNYQFVLIYQLDAYVFEDKLAYWCNKNYDYIGAPWLSEPLLANGKPMINIQKWFIDKVGNGGLSLRKVAPHYRNTLFFKPILSFFSKNEDMFWGLFLYWLNPFFKRPKAKEALNFAFETEPKKSFELINKKLPFGVHAWEKYEPEFWQNKVY